MKKHRLFLYGLSQPDLFGNHNIGIRTPGIGVENHIKSIAAPRGFLALSATQIGDVWSAFIILKKMFIKNAQWKDYKGLKNSSYDAYLNPKIIDYSVEKKMGWEESASYPGFRFLIERSVKIKVRYSVDKRLDDKEEQLEGFHSKIYQNQMNQLESVDLFKISQQIEVIDSNLKKQHDSQLQEAFNIYKRQRNKKLENSKIADSPKVLYEKSQSFNEFRRLAVFNIIHHYKQLKY